MPPPPPTGAYLRTNPSRTAGIIALVALLHVLGVLIFLNFGHKIRLPDLLIKVTIVKPQPPAAKPSLPK